MPGRSAQTLISGREALVPSGDYLLNTGDIWNGTTRYEASQTRRYVNSGTTDANGRITFNLTTDGTTNGPVLYSSILCVNCDTQTNTTNLANIPYFFIESISANLKQVTIRGVSSQAGLVILSIGITQIQFAGSGLTGRINVVGLP